MAELEEYIKKVYTHESKYPGRLPKGRVFPSTDVTPKLSRNQTNRILIYNGSFNPPHRGHLHLLEHTFCHGSHDLNLIAAVIYPSRDDSLEGKCKKAGSNFRFGRDERSMLWKRDSCFPSWAWVHEARGLVGFLRSLKDVTSNDGYDVEYVRLQGPSSDDHLEPPDEDAFLGGCSDTLVISDAARLTNYRRSSGRMRNFHGWTKWKGIRVDEVEMLKLAELRTLALCDDAIRDESTDNDLDLKMVESVSDSSKEATTAKYHSLLADMKQVLYCRTSINSRALTIRFVKAVHDDPRHYTSSTELRRKMSNLVRGGMPVKKGTIERLALSPDVLWHFQQQWGEKAKNQLNELIAFDLDDFISQNPSHEEEEAPKDNHACWACKTADRSDTESIKVEVGESPPLHFEWSWEDCEHMKKPGRWMQEPISDMDIDLVATDTIDDDDPCKDQFREQEILDLVPEKCEPMEE